MSYLTTENIIRLRSVEHLSTLLNGYIPALFFSILFLSSCSTDNRHFRMEGRFRHLNQGEFYVYSPDGIIDRMDTVRVQDGRFSYSVTCDHEGTLIMVFPNFSEQPVFVKPGKSVDIKADASHLKEMEVSGTKENKLMNEFRQAVANVSPPEAIKMAELTIRDHPASVVSIYLLKRYFLQTATPDYKKANELVTLIQQATPPNSYIAQLAHKVKSLSHGAVGEKLPIVTATDINGQKVNTATLSKAPVAVVLLWAYWNYDSMNMQRELKRIYRTAGGKMQLLSICIDASKENCQQIIKNDSITWPTVCDGLMFDSPIVEQLGLSAVPDNIILQNGRIVAHGLNLEEMKKELEKIL